MVKKLFLWMLVAQLMLGAAPMYASVIDDEEVEVEEEMEEQESEQESTTAAVEPRFTFLNKNIYRPELKLQMPPLNMSSGAEKPR